MDALIEKLRAWVVCSDAVARHEEVKARRGYGHHNRVGIPPPRPGTVAFAADELYELARRLL